MSNVYYSEIEILIEALENQVARPARAVVNFEASFVRDRLQNAGHDDLARRYWSWTCSNWRANPIFGPEVLALQKELESIDRQSTMPSWGTYGT
jgi:hypothetical protein